MSTATRSQRQVLDTVESTFRALTREPHPLALDCTGLSPSLPQREIPLDELRQLMLNRRVSGAARDAVWTELIVRARDGDPVWVVAAAGMALPALRAVADLLSYSCPPSSVPDLDVEVLAGFCDALRTIPVEWKWLATHLRHFAFQAGMRFVTREVNDAARAGVALDVLEESVAPPPPWGHPDFVLDRAVRDEVITASEAELIGRSRLERTHMTRLAAEWNTSYSTLRRRRKDAEARLVAWLRPSKKPC